MAVITKRKNNLKSKSSMKTKKSFKSKSNSKTRKQFKNIRKNGMGTRKMMGGAKGASFWKKIKSINPFGKKGKVAPSTPPSTPSFSPTKVHSKYNSASSFRVMTPEEKKINTQYQMNLALTKEEPVIQHSNINNQTQEKKIHRVITNITDPKTLQVIQKAFNKKTTPEEIKQNNFNQEKANHIADVLKKNKLLNGINFSKKIANYGINPKNNKPIIKQIYNLYNKSNRTKKENNLIRSIENNLIRSI
jgi:hypothetical protein